MKKRFDHIFQFKVTLRSVKPPVWRRVQVPCKYTFWDLHVAIQDAMGWFNCHLHQHDQLLPAGEILGIVVPLISFLQLIKFISRENIEQLYHCYINLPHSLVLFGVNGF